jgi:hypothetical protein
LKGRVFPIASTTLASILSIGGDPMLFALRSAVLRKGGFTVFEARSPQQVLSISPAADIMVAVLCHTIPASERRELVHAIRRCHPHSAVLALHTGWERVEEADESIESLSGPQTLLDCIAALIHNPSYKFHLADRLRYCG